MEIRRFPTSLLLIGLSLEPAVVRAQDDATKPIVLGGFETQVSVTAGYRFTDVNGYRPKFQQLFDLNSGFRLLDFSLFGQDREGANRFADSYSLNVSGLGGDPYTTAQFTARKTKVYDLRVDYRQTRFYWDQNDAVGSNGFTAITSYHNWATVRKFGTVSLLVHATNNLRFRFEYLRNTRDGVNFTTRTMDYFGSSATWGAFARADPYYLIAPLSESSNRITGGVDYTHDTWSFHYKIGYQRFEDSVTGSNLLSGQRSINVNDATTRLELLSGASWTDYRKLNTPISEFSYNGKITPRLETRGGYLFYRYSGPASLDLSANGVARTNTAGTAFAPYAFSLTSRATNSEPNHIIDQGFTYKVNEWWNVQADYRYARLNVDSNGVFRSVNGLTIANGTAFNQWRIGTSQLDFRMLFAPSSSLLVTAGVRYLKSDVENLQDGLADPTRTKRIKSVWPTLTASWEPNKIFTVRGDVESLNNGTSYTRITPHTSVGGRVMVTVHPTEKLSISNTFLARNSKLLASDYRSTIRSNSTNVSFDFTERIRAFGGFSYDSLFASDFTTFLRGTGPLTDTIREQTVNRVWDGGIELKPVKRLRVNFTGNYVRSTGLGEISGEPPLYGPLSFPYATGLLDYDIPRFGILGVRLQRTYYLEQIITANNFGAKLLTVTWTRNF